VLGRGVRSAAAIIGGEADGLAYHVKGLELTAFDPRGAHATALGYAVGNRGADFTSIYARHELTQTPEEAVARYGDERAADSTSPVGKAVMVRRGMIVCAVLDWMGLCKIPVLTIVSDFSLEGEAHLAREVTGLALTSDDLFAIGERIVNAERLLNLRFGATCEDDTLPARFLEEALPDGPHAGSRLCFENMLAEFYEAMDWSPTGVPRSGRLRSLGLERYEVDPT
jgi:aldehyde:ferredoxin oxidoreductase